MCLPPAASSFWAIASNCPRRISAASITSVLLLRLATITGSFTMCCFLSASASTKLMMLLLLRGVAVRSRMKSGFRFFIISTDNWLSALWLSSTTTTGRRRRITLIKAEGSCSGNSQSPSP